MPAGLKIINDAGTILIDDAFPVPVLRDKGDAIFPASGYIYLGSRTGQVALRCTSVASYSFFNQTDPFSAGLYLFGMPGTMVTWYLFDEPAEPASNFGLVIRNAAGKLMYDAGAKPMRVVNLRSSGVRAGWQGAVNLDGARTYAVLPMVAAFDSVMTFTRQGSGSPDEFFQREDISLAGGAVNGGSITFGMTQSSRRQYGPYYGISLPRNYTVSSNNAALAVIDMTAY
ncbi:hypothetical protein [[Pseudomonas] boreopolis]|uniref:hypothetical protein n=1 Tax=Xanthomonas boreopolis TaxID=86183 RepID=UPI003DA0932B